MKPWNKIVLVFSILVALIFSCQSKNKNSKNNNESKRPNIIFLLTDDQRWDALGAMGNTIISTPHLDSLAHHGFLFKNAYVTTSICCVSRASILSGQYESRHGINDFNTSFSKKAFLKTYPALLKNEGYTVGFIGKYGVGAPYNQPKDFFDYWACTNKHQPDYDNVTRKGNYIHYTDIVGNDINSFLNSINTKKPFCLSVSFKAPHVQDNDPRQFIPKKEYSDLYKTDSISLPETVKEKYWDAFPAFFKTNKNIGRIRWKKRFNSYSAFKKSVKNYYRLITGVDDVIGNLLSELKAKQIDKNTVIILLGDNGMFLGEHGLAGKWYGYEESIRVPLIIYDPRISQRGKVINKIALNIDIAPTILGLANMPIPDSIQGVNLMEYIKKDQGRPDFFYEHTFLHSPAIPNSEGVVSENFKYLNYIEHNYEELFDLKKDPNETTNLVNDPQYRDTLLLERKRYSALKEQVK
ncbi:sulfatase family protein [Gaetbulibacter aestuarii]|uniref:Sulfatase n=1 Tax=Gaetbulibacter aestuarii TaxID=1502358 RepID=A0ABW7N2G4_9FLAO